MRSSRLRRPATGLIAIGASIAAVLGVGLTPTLAQASPLPDDAIAATLPARLAEASSYAAGRPGTTGIVITDRRTGIILTNDRADTPVWTASTIKLAIATDLLRRDRTGAIHLSSNDRALMHRMLHSSDDAATDALWFAYAGRDHQTFNRDFRAFGMTSLAPQRSFSAFYPYWVSRRTLRVTSPVSCRMC